MNSLSRQYVIGMIFFLSLFITPFASNIKGDYYPQLEFDYSPDYLNSRIIFTCFDYNIMNILLQPGGFLEQFIYNSFLQDYLEKTFFIEHSFELASNSFDSDLINFLEMIAIPDSLNDTDNLSRSYQRMYPREFNYSGRFISANATDTWLTQNYNSYFGSPPVPGYTLIIANMTSLDNSTFTNHWYNETYYDMDSNLDIRKNYMIGYGGNSRLYYLDLTSDSYYIQDAGENSTLQEMSLLYDFTSYYGLRKLAEYLAEWIFEIERNLWVQNFSFAPLHPVGAIQTGNEFFFEILIFNNITNYENDDLTWIINKDLILETVQELLPWNNMNISINFVRLQDIQRLSSVIHQSLVPWGMFKSSLNNYFAIDLLPVYREVSQNRFLYSNYTDSSSFYTSHILVAAFLFDNALFGISKKAQIEPSILGISLRDQTNRPLSIISEDFNYIYGENRSNPQRIHGLTKLIIHELGQQLGLMHPFQYGTVGNFLDDIMTDYTHSNKFSIFSRDNIQRGQIDMFIKVGRSKILTAFEYARNKVYNKEVYAFFETRHETYMKIKEYYSEMNYSQSYSLAKNFYLSMFNIDLEFNEIPNKKVYYDFIPVIFLCSLIFLTFAVYYRTKSQILFYNTQKRKLMTNKVAEGLIKKSKERFIALRKSNKEMIDNQLNKSPSKNQHKKEG